MFCCCIIVSYTHLDAIIKYRGLSLPLDRRLERNMDDFNYLINRMSTVDIKVKVRSTVSCLHESKTFAIDQKRFTVSEEAADIGMG